MKARNFAIACAVLFAVYAANYLIYPGFYKQRQIVEDFTNQEYIHLVAVESNDKANGRVSEERKNLLSKYREEDLGKQRSLVGSWCFLLALAYGAFLFRGEIMRSGVVKDFMKDWKHSEAIEDERNRAELNSLRVPNAIYEQQAVQAGLVTEAMRIGNDNLRQEVSAIAANNSITFGQADLIKKILYEVSVNTITPAQAYVWVKSLNPIADVQIDMASQELMIREELEAKRAENRKKVAEARREEAQAELDEYTKNETIGPNTKG